MKVPSQSSQAMVVAVAAAVTRFAASAMTRSGSCKNESWRFARGVQHYSSFISSNRFTTSDVVMFPSILSGRNISSLSTEDTTKRLEKKIVDALSSKTKVCICSQKKLLN